LAGGGKETKETGGQEHDGGAEDYGGIVEVGLFRILISQPQGIIDPWIRAVIEKSFLCSLALLLFALDPYP
jgi:hypothetical protein